MATNSSRYSLPDKVPELASYKMNLVSAFAIYHTVPLSQEEGVAILAAILLNSDVVGDEAAMFSIPRRDFSGEDKAVAAVAAHHMVLAQEHAPDTEWPRFNPTVFFVVDDADWRLEGVVLVSLNTDGEGSTEAFRVHAQGAALIPITIALGDSSWEEEWNLAQGKLLQERVPSTPSLIEGFNLLTMAARPPVIYWDGPQAFHWTGCNGRMDPCFALVGPRGKCNFTNLQILTNGREAWERGLRDCPCRLAPWIKEFEFTEEEEKITQKTLMRWANLQLKEKNKYEPHLIFHRRLFVWADQNFEKDGVLLCKFDVFVGKSTNGKSRRVPAEKVVVELLKMLREAEAWDMEL